MVQDKENFYTLGLRNFSIKPLKHLIGRTFGGFGVGRELRVLSHVICIFSVSVPKALYNQKAKGKKDR